MTRAKSLTNIGYQLVPKRTDKGVNKVQMYAPVRMLSKEELAAYNKPVATAESKVK